MKKLIPTILILCNLLLYSQNEIASIEPIKPTFGVITDYSNNKDLAKNETKKPSSRELAFSIALENATAAFLANEFNKCIEYYNTSEKLNFYDPVFEFYTGVSYYELWKKTANKKYKIKAKRLLKLSKKHGFKGATSIYKKELFK